MIFKTIYIKIIKLAIDHLLDLLRKITYFLERSLKMVDITDFEPYLKQYYNTYSPYNVSYRAGPFYGQVNKRTRAGGKNFSVPQQYANPQSTSSNFSVSISNAGSGMSLAEFLVPNYPKLYSTLNIDEDLLANARSDEFAFQTALVTSVNSTIAEHGKRLAISFWGDGSGALAQVLSVNSNTVTLVDPTHARRFSIGQKVYTTDTLLSTEPTNTQTVTGVDAIAGTVTFGTLPTGTLADWYLFNQGDYATSLGSKFVGFTGWVPTAVTGAWATLFSTNRTADPTLLAGIRVDGSNLTPKQAMIQTIQNLVANGADATSVFKVFMHPVQYAVLLQTLESQRVYTAKDVELPGLNISYRGIAYVGAGFTMEIFQDMWIDSDKIAVCDFDKWHFENSVHAAMMTSDGLDLLRLETQDSVQLRIRTYGQLVCAAVAHQGLVYNLPISL